jgi:hypothetical protein
MFPLSPPSTTDQQTQNYEHFHPSSMATSMIDCDDEDYDDHSSQSNSSSSSFSNSSSSLANINIPEITLDLAWSSLSDSIFLMGGLCYLILSIWDIILVEAEEDDADVLASWQKRMYAFIENAGPIVYLINSVIDVRWATDSQRMEKQRRRLVERPTTTTTTTTNNNNIDSSPARPPKKTPKQKKKKRIKVVKAKWNRVRKFAAHRRGLFAAFTFGVAAFLAVLDVFLWDTGEANYDSSLVPESDRGWFDFLSVHFYFLSALFALTGQRSKPRKCAIDFRNDPDMLEDLGDYLFLIGSLFDVVICDFHFDDGSEIWWSAVSSILWFLDACFYLRSDYCTAIVFQDLLSAGKNFAGGDTTEDGPNTNSSAATVGATPSALLGAYVHMESFASGCMT